MMPPNPHISVTVFKFSSKIDLDGLKTKFGKKNSHCTAFDLRALKVRKFDT